MRAIGEFVKTTLIGGLLIVLPVYIAVLLILKAVQGLVTAVKPITAAIPGSVKFEEILAILIHRRFDRPHQGGFTSEECH
jgi:hypothetical protein